MKSYKNIVIIFTTTVISTAAIAVPISYVVAANSTASIDVASLTLQDTDSSGTLDSSENLIPMTISYNSGTGACITVSSANGSLVRSGAGSPESYEKISMKLLCPSIITVDNTALTSTEWVQSGVAGSHSLYSLGVDTAPVSSQQVQCAIYSSEDLATKSAGTYDDEITISLIESECSS